ncbi:MAG: TIGR02281 family clan AA aspartic protease [Deltaproteobacteria bacterium]|nr:TIGR02281 family clan AA aspartic protease [Deltaproteobacteria bacterium]
MNILKPQSNQIKTTLLIVMGIFFSSQALAIKSISAYALFNGKAILTIDGKRHMLHTGETSPEGLKLLSSTTTAAVISIDGKEEVIGLSVNATSEAMHLGGNESPDYVTTVTLNMGASGFFHAEGEINNKSVVFLVDTGANSVAMNVSTARRLDIDYESGKKSLASTANGVTRMYSVVLDKVSVGAIEIDNVEAAVIQDPGPAGILLGMSFLSKLEMNRSGTTMELIKR